MEWNEYYQFRKNVCNICKNKCRQRIEIDKCISEGINLIPKYNFAPNEWD